MAVLAPRCWSWEQLPVATWHCLLPAHSQRRCFINLGYWHCAEIAQGWEHCVAEILRMSLVDWTLRVKGRWRVHLASLDVRNDLGHWEGEGVRWGVLSSQKTNIGRHIRRWVRWRIIKWLCWVKIGKETRRRYQQQLLHQHRLGWGVFINQKGGQLVVNEHWVINTGRAVPTCETGQDGVGRTRVRDQTTWVHLGHLQALFCDSRDQWWLEEEGAVRVVLPFEDYWLEGGPEMGAIRSGEEGDLLPHDASDRKDQVN